MRGVPVKDGTALPSMALDEGIARLPSAGTGRGACRAMVKCVATTVPAPAVDTPRRPWLGRVGAQHVRHGTWTPRGRPPAGEGIRLRHRRHPHVDAVADDEPT